MQNLVLLRLALNIARTHSEKDAMRGKLKHTSLDDDFLIELIRTAIRLEWFQMRLP